MKNRARGGLGRGLGALIPTAPAAPEAPPAAAPVPAAPVSAAPVVSEAPPASPSVEAQQPVADPPSAPAADELAPVPGARFAEIDVTAIEPNSKQPRHVFDEEALDELKTSI